MTKPSKIPGKIIGGQFFPANPKNWDNVMLAYSGSDVILSVKKRENIRSLPQNSYLHGVVYKMIADETGSDTESIHHAMKDMFLKKESDGPIPKVWSTTELTNCSEKERQPEDPPTFRWYIEQIIKWAAEYLGMYIPLPNEKEMWGGR